MKIKWSKDVELHIVISADNEGNILDDDIVSIKKGTENKVDIIEDYGRMVDMQFEDGSIAYSVPKSCFGE
jgi:hypothetical protein